MSREGRAGTRLVPVSLIGIVAVLVLSGIPSIPHLPSLPLQGLPSHGGSDASALSRPSTGPGVLLADRGLEPNAAPWAVHRASPAAEAHPSASHVNPFLSHSTEPAPMGVADFGVTGTGGGASAYAYSTSSFEARALVRSMSISATVGSSTVRVAAFELNAVVVFQLGGTNYSYWIQNGLHLDSSTNEYTIGGAYVWNFSSPTAHLGVSELRGNSSSVLASDTYYFIPGCGVFAGQCSTLSLPANLTARIGLSTCGGFPCVDYQYDIGAGWVTYDSVSFLHLSGATPIGFLVSGYQYTPLGTGTYYDAEWDWVAAVGGHSGRDGGSDMEMALEFWNGGSYQPVPNAWNFGGDTGESSFNVTDVLAAGPGGAPVGRITSGSGTLGLLYNQSSIGSLNVTVPTRSAERLRIADAVVSIQGGSANLTLVAGDYAVALQNYSNATSRITILPGQTARLNLSGAGLTEFQETGLPTGTIWTVTVGNLSNGGPERTRSFHLANGTYPVAYSTVPGFYRNGSNPSTVAVPTPGPIPIGWSPFTFLVPFTESGLPDGTDWWVNASGAFASGSTSTLELPAPNGSTEFFVGSAYEYVASPPNGTIRVVGGAFFPVQVQFAYRPCYIAGTVDPVEARLVLDGAPLSVSAGSFNASVIPGEYTLVASADGFITQRLDVFATPGNVTSEQISLIQNQTSGNVTPNVSPPPGPGVLVWAGLGIAVAAIAGGAILLGLRRRSRSE